MGEREERERYSFYTRQRALAGLTAVLHQDNAGSDHECDGKWQQNGVTISEAAHGYCTVDR